MTDPILMPVQSRPDNRQRATVRSEVVLRAYEVYCALHGEQPAMIDVAKGCRGGFGSGELIAYLYARTFDRKEWSARFDEAVRGMNV